MKIFLSFIVGVAITSFLFIPAIVYIPLFLLILIIFVFIKPKQVLPVLVIFLFFILGVIRYEISLPKIDKNHVSFYNNQTIVFQGKVIKEPIKRIDKLKLIIGNVSFQKHKLKGRILVNAPVLSDYKYGDILEVECNLNQSQSSDRFNYYEWLAKDDIYFSCYWPKIKIITRKTGNFFYEKILLFKSNANSLINKNFSQPQGSILTAMLLGIRHQIPPLTRDNFSQAGISHILAISGLHISIICLLLITFFVNTLHISQAKSFYLMCFAISLFVLLVGAPVSAVRAAIMGIILSYATKIGRPKNFMQTLAFVCVLMLLLNPRVLKSDIGFQLSFMAVLGIGMFRDYFNHIFSQVPNNNKFPLRYYLSITLSAQIFVLPLVLYWFGSLSLISLLSNILILPLLSFLMIFGFLFIFLGLIFPWLVNFLLWPVWILLTYVVLIAKIGANIPYLSFYIKDFSFLGVIGLYVLILIWFFKIKGITNHKL
ncbi:ComEC/Rec2 family competence protein [Patescibacteria group bacterium]|nr:ComEC/Rec2 family competence protein [Patescibacteria group bacterium]